MSKTPGRRNRNRPPKPAHDRPTRKRRLSVHIEHGSLRTGIAVTADLTVRLATPSEVDDLATWQHLAVSDPPQWAPSVLARAAHSGVLSSALLAGLSDGPQARTEVTSRGMTRSAVTDEPPAMYLSTAAVLVAEVHGVLQGMVYAGPSPVLGQHAANLALRSSGSDREALGAHICTVVGTSKIHFISVSPEARGHGVGAALLATATELFRRSEYFRMYGQFETTRLLEPFYRAAGFDVLAVDEPIWLDSIYGFEAAVLAEPNERLFTTRLN